MTSFGQTVNRLPRRIYRGWLIVLVAFLASFWGVGAVQFSFSVLLAPLSSDLGIPRTSAVVGLSLSGVVSGLVSPLAGRIVDLYGARWLMVISAICAGGSLLALSLVHDLWLFLLLFGVALGLSRPGLAGVASTATVANWFIKKRGKAISVSALGPPTSSLITVPISQWVSANYGWRTVWVGLGLGIWGFLVLPAALIVRRRPEDVGLLPDGEVRGHTEAEIARGEPGVPESPPPAEVAWTARDALRTSTFWFLVLGFTLTGLVNSGVLVHMFPYFIERGIAPDTASQVFSSFGAMVIMSRLFLWGYLLDRLQMRYTITVWALVMTAAHVLLALVDSTPTAFIAAMALGISQGGSAPLQGTVWAHYYGRRSVGTITGFAHFVFTASQAAGPLFPSLIFDITHSYASALWTYVVCCLGGAILLFLAKPPVSGVHNGSSEELGR